MRIIVTGLVGNYAFGGVAWDYLQYVLGFRALGHDVWYLEDTGAWAYDPIKQEPSADCSYNVNYLRRVMEDLDLGDRWIYRNGADGTTHGIDDAALADKLIAESDVLANVSGACWLREPTAKPTHRLFLDGDPMFTQARLIQSPGTEYDQQVRHHTEHFSFGLNIGEPDCVVPEAGLKWLPTVQPIALGFWKKNAESDAEAARHPAHGAYTTVMNWASYKPVEFNGRSYGQKDIEFEKFRSLPSRVGVRFVIAMGQGVGSRRPTAQLESEGWHILEPHEHLPDHATYRTFITHSRAEWSIAKNGYVAANTGWFSCRSACYLAAGIPVVVQDTGWSRHLPAGQGALAFRTMEEAVAAIQSVEENYEQHSRAALAFAQEHLEASRVCQDILEKAGIA